MNLEEMKNAGKAPVWMQEEGFKTLQRGYLIDDETPRDMYERVAKAAGSYYSNSEYWSRRFFDAMWNNWLCPSTPVLANMGTRRGLPISCNAVHVPDSLDGIFNKVHELAMLSKNGAGVAVYLGDVRGRGAPISGNGKSVGVIPWCRNFDTATATVSQGSTRQGASAVYLQVDHPDIEEFLDIRRPVGDVQRRCLNLNHGVCITNKWMEEMLAGDLEKRRLWEKIMVSRVETGEPYLFFTDSANADLPDAYVKNGLRVKSSNICTEITLYTDSDHSFVCCLSSLNLTNFESWPADLPATAVRFLDSVISEYLVKSEGMPGLEPSRRSAIKGRAIGIGVLGWHTLLQESNIPFDSFDAMMLNNRVFKTIRTGAEAESKLMAQELGEPEWCKGTGRRHTHLMAVAPTVSNSIISGGHSAGIEPIAANMYSLKSAKGTFFRTNPTLTKKLESLGKNTPAVWKSINQNYGSVQHLDFLSEHDKLVFLTAREINQHAIIKQAEQRQKWIDQAQSINLFFASNSSPKYIHEVHIAAWKAGIKTLYYLRSEGVIRGDLASRSKDECAACEG